MQKSLSPKTEKTSKLNYYSPNQNYEETNFVKDDLRGQH